MLQPWASTIRGKGALGVWFAQKELKLLPSDIFCQLKIYLKFFCSWDPAELAALPDSIAGFKGAASWQRWDSRVNMGGEKERDEKGKGEKRSEWREGDEKGMGRMERKGKGWILPPCKNSYGHAWHQPLRMTPPYDTRPSWPRASLPCRSF